jgi:hypothetical protein
MQGQFNEDYYGQEDPDFLPGGKYFLEDEEGREQDAAEGRSAVGGWNDDEGDEAWGYEGQYEEEGDGDDGDGELGNAEMDAELYKLDYEDIVAGIPCRFKYATVAAEGYGLTIDDILDAEDSELNKYVGLKKISASYREERRAEGGQEGKLSRKRKHLREAIKQRKAEAEEKQNAKLLEEAEEEEKKAAAIAEAGGDGDNDAGGGGKKMKRKRNKKKTIGGNFMALSASAVNESTDEKITAALSTDKDKNAKEKKKKKTKRAPAESNLSEKDQAKKRRMDLYD